MSKKKTLLYSLISLSVGFLLYNYIFTDYKYGMMRHHYGYYDGFSINSFYLNSALVFVAYVVIILCLFTLIYKKQKSKSNAITILDNRLSKGDITLEEYKKIRTVIQGNDI